MYRSIQKFTEKVVRKLGRPSKRWQDRAKLFSEKCCQIWNSLDWRLNESFFLQLTSWSTEKSSVFRTGLCCVLKILALLYVALKGTNK